MRDKYYLLMKDGKVVHRGTENDHLRYIHEMHSFSYDCALKDQGFSIVACGKMEKRKEHAFGKDTYLLGETEFDEYLWLEAGQWACGWYWGFGYVEIYTNNKNPARARDINSHSHFDGLVGFKDDNGNYIHHLNESPKMKSTVLSSSESWELSDLMKSFYTLRATAELYHSGNSHLTTVKGLNLKNRQAEKRINTVEIPKVMEAVYDLLSPVEAEKK